MWWWVLWTWLIVTAGFACLGAWLFVSQGRLIFRPVKLNGQAAYVQEYSRYEWTISQKGVLLRGWLLNPDRPNLIIYYGGNAEEISANLRDFSCMDEFAVLLLYYRGYGLSGGRPSERHLLADALYAFDQVHSQRPGSGKIVLFGRSLGTAVALYVAKNRPVDGVILITPFDSIREVAQRYFWFVPVRWFILHPFDAVLHSRDVRVPMLAVVAGNDEIVPAGNTRRLVEQLGNRCEAVTIQGAGHNNVHLYPACEQAIRRFLGARISLAGQKYP